MTEDERPEWQQAVQRHAAWITEAREFAAKSDHDALVAAIGKLDDTSLRDVILTMVLADRGEEKRQREKLWREWAARAGISAAQN